MSVFPLSEKIFVNKSFFRVLLINKKLLGVKIKKAVKNTAFFVFLFLIFAIVIIYYWAVRRVKVVNPTTWYT